MLKPSPRFGAVLAAIILVLAAVSPALAVNEAQVSQETVLGSATSPSTVNVAAGQSLTATISSLPNVTLAGGTISVLPQVTLAGGTISVLPSINGTMVPGGISGAFESFSGSLTKIVKGAAGVCDKLVIDTPAPGASITLWDNASTASGTKLGVFDASATGSTYPLDIFVANGIVAVESGGSASVTVTYQ